MNSKVPLSIFNTIIKPIGSGWGRGRCGDGYGSGWDDDWVEMGTGTVRGWRWVGMGLHQDAY